MKKYISLLLFPFLLFQCETPKEKTMKLEIVKGVSEQIAQYRKAHISNIQYELFFSIPKEKNVKIPASLKVSFELDTLAQPLILDFNVDSTFIKSVKKQGNDIPFTHKNEHIVIPTSELVLGQNTFQIEFTTGELSLNRQEEFLYTLFVPDRASTAFPCFDKPDLKAKYKLSLEIPEEWQAVTNYALKDSTITEGRKTLHFNETAPLSTYLFAFAVGDFKTKTEERNGREMTMYYRENDEEKVDRNTQAIFDLHGKSLEWLIDYTQIEYPFEKFDFVLVPSFQYGGMEHPGSIFYRESSLFLEESATLNDELGRASLIAHETSHIWFGDLVTMKWFDDVWAKEVFANFMADKIVNPSFPDINHSLKFMLRHHPRAYSVDRTKGANAIRQHLGNLKEAGLMYGAIIYQKAPIAMKHLEQITGEEALRDGLREYLKNFSFDNADWNDLIKILDRKTESNLGEWSSIWIEQAGMPTYQSAFDYSMGKTKVQITQSDPTGNERLWMQELNPSVYYRNVSQSQSVFFNQAEGEVSFESEKPSFIFLNGNGTEYGTFLLDEQSIEYLLIHITELKDVYLQGKLWLNLYESLMNGKIPPATYFHALQVALPQTQDPQLQNLLLAHWRTVFWRLLTPTQREEFSIEGEKVLEDMLRHSENKANKAAIFRTYINTFYSEKAKSAMLKIWEMQTNEYGIPLSPNDYTSLAMELAVRGVEQSEEILNRQIERLENPDRKKRLSFIQPVLSQKEADRDAFFESLKKLENRAREPWVLSALRYLHHPLQTKTSIKYLGSSLEMLEEIQLTGDIFFPTGWASASFSGYQTQEAAQIANDFLAQNPNYNPKLKQKILQATDMVERSSEIIGKYGLN